MLPCPHKCLALPEYLHLSSSLVPHLFFSLVHLHNIWERAEFILDCIIIIVSPSPHQPRGCTNNLQFATHKMDDRRIFLYSNAVITIFHYKVVTCLSWILSCSKSWHPGTNSVCSEELCCTIAQCIIKSFRAVGSIAWLVTKTLYLRFTLFLFYQTRYILSPWINSPPPVIDLTLSEGLNMS